MAAASVMWNHSTAGIHAPAMAKPASDASGNNSSSGDDGSTISANDFLTLLVTEMQNQDPTADTDPNEYINQLVQVNSLEQLIDINQNLSTALGTSASGSETTPSTQAAHAVHRPGTGAVSAAQSTSGAQAGSSAFVRHGTNPVSQGNLSVPTGNAAAHRVAEALSGSK